MLAVAGRGVDELRLGHTLDVDTFTGAATLRVPLPVPAGRAGVRPDLALIQAMARLFNDSVPMQIEWYRKIRSAVPQWAPNLDPNSVTGSPRRR